MYFRILKFFRNKKLKKIQIAREKKTEILSGGKKKEKGRIEKDNNCWKEVRKRIMDGA